MLKADNWQLWRHEVILGAKRIRAYGILTGTEPRPSPTQATAETSKVEALQSLLSTVQTTSAIVDTRHQRLQATPEDQKADALDLLAQAQMNAVAAIKAYSEATQAPKASIVASATDSALTKAWINLHDTLYHALLTSLSDDIRIMTLNCTTAPETWQKLQDYFEGKAAADQRAAEMQLHRAHFSKPSEIPAFLNEVRLATNSLAASGQPISDDKLFLTILDKLPTSMRHLKDNLLYGHHDLRTYKHLSLTLEEYAKNNIATSQPEHANIAFNDKKCKYCHRQGHTIDECKTKIHVCKICNKKGHFEKRCRSKDQTKIQSKPTGNDSSGKPDGKSPDSSYFAFLAQNPERASFNDAMGKEPWIVDTGASVSICPDLEESTRVSGQTITIGDGTTLNVSGHGTIQEKGLNLSTVFKVPQIQRRLLSISRACTDGDIDEARFTSSGCQLLKNNSIIVKGVLQNGLYVIHRAKEHIHFADESKEMLWHHRLAHAPFQQIAHIIKTGVASGIDKLQLKPPPAQICSCCCAAKATRAPFQPRDPSRRANRPGIVLHADICGPIPTTSLQGNRYILPIVDEHSRFVTVYFLSSKAQAAAIIIECIRHYNNFTGSSVSILQTDNGGEFSSHEFRRKLTDLGVRIQTSVAYNPEQNGVAERMNRTLIDRARALLLHASMPPTFWQCAVATAAHVSNRLPSSTNNGRSPYELWTAHIPNLGHLRVFGCRAYAHIPPQLRTKFDAKSRACTFTGYATQQRGYMLYDEKAKSFFSSRSVIFDEANLPFQVKASPNPTVIVHPINTPIYDDICRDSNIDSDSDPDAPTKRSENLLSNPPFALDHDHAPSEDFVDDNTKQRRSTRVRGQPIRLSDEQEDAMARRQLQSQAPLEDKESVNLASAAEEPTSYRSALTSVHSAKWKSAMESEISSLMENSTWTLTTLPKDAKVVGSKWIYKLKLDENGKPQRFKARLVAQGFSQRYGIDYDETFSPVVSKEAIRILIGLKANGWTVHQLDVDTAYLNAALDTDVFLAQPHGYEQEGPNGETLVCRLEKAIYGLRQAGRQWYLHLSNLLINEMGFTRSRPDECLFLKVHNGTTVILGTYVDDIIIASNSALPVKTFEIHISKFLKVKLLGDLHHILGMKISTNQDGSVNVSQQSYTDQILQRFKMADCNPVKTPALAEQQQSLTDSEPHSIADFPYREAVGSLLHLANLTRPDIMQAVHHAARFMVSPKLTNITAVKRIFRYLQSTKHLGIRFLPTTQNAITVYSDADFANDVQSRKSTTGYCIFTNGPVLWRSKKQTLTAVSTTEAEYIALADASKAALHIHQLLVDMTLIPKSAPIIMLGDNASSISIAKGCKFTPRTKHIDVNHHFIRDLTTTGRIHLSHVATDKMVADPLTKPVGPVIFSRLRPLLLGHVPLEGGC
jgi:hypothetical protein